MKLESRAYDKKTQSMLYNLEIQENGMYLGRKEGTEDWEERPRESLIFQKSAGCRDILNRPIFEEDIVRDNEGKRYRVVYHVKAQTLSLYDVDERKFYPLERTHELEIIGNNYMRLEIIAKRQSEEFPKAPVFSELKEIRDEKIELKSFNRRKQERLENPMVNKRHLTKEEAVEIPYFIQKTEEERRREHARFIKSTKRTAQDHRKSFFISEGTTRFVDFARKAIKR